MVSMFLVSLITLLFVFPWSAPASTQLAPVQIDFGPDFLGDDGLWSPVQIRVGTNPEQWLLVLPNTLSSDTWVIGPGGCDGTQICQADRGGLFYWNQSSTWRELGYFDLGYTDITGASLGQYGLDNVSISNTVSVPQLPVAIVNSTRLWLGQLGLNVKETRFNDNTAHISFLSSLVQNLSLIPSHSYGYTAGAPYALKGVPGSLTLGGVDTTRFTSTASSFTLGSNYEPSLAITSIQVSSAVFEEMTIPSNWNNNPVTLSSHADAFTATIDSSTPFLWFPESVCDMFASALNLTYDTNLQLYVYPANMSSKSLLLWGLEFTFFLANLPNSTATSDVTISFNAFNLQLSYPFPGLNAVSTSPSVDYFPLRRANSTTQFTIGRAFLQETYLAVDYERSTFSLYPAFFPDLSKVSPNLVAITRPAGSTWPGPQITTNSLSTGAKAGIGIGIALVVLVIAGLLYLYIRRRRAGDGKSEKPKKSGVLGMFRRRKNSEAMVPELLGDKRHPEELRADTSNSRFELGGGVPFEMPAGEVSSAYYQANLSTRESAVARNDPRRPAELAHHGSMSKGAVASAFVPDSRSQSPVPPYSPSDNSYGNQGLGNSVSPNSVRNSNIFAGSESSGEQGISPITAHPNSNRRFASINSQSTPSPISPVMPSDLHTNPPNSTESSTENSYLIPRAHAPARTASRNSRFREELTDEASQPSSGPEGVRRRYSWEE